MRITLLPILAWKQVELIKEKPQLAIARRPESKLRPVVIGSGPAGMFAVLALAGSRAKADCYRTGKPVNERQEDVRSFWAKGC